MQCNRARVLPLSFTIESACDCIALQLCLYTNVSDHTIKISKVMNRGGKVPVVVTCLLDLIIEKSRDKIFLETQACNVDLKLHQILWL